MPEILKPNVKLEAKKIDDILLGIRYVSSIPFARKAFAIPKIKAKLLAYLFSIFPKSTRPDHTSHIVTGFRTYDIPGYKDKVGFVLQHRDYKNVRTEVILKSLEEGSRGYYRYPSDPGDGGSGIFSFFPGRRNPGRFDFATRKRIHIPRRAGKHYMQSTMEYAQQLILDAKPEFFKQAREAVKKGKRS